jgi:opacity protein-like surface antigen
MRKSILSILFCGFASMAQAQTDSLMALLSDGQPKKCEPVTATFKATRIINSSSVENLAAGVLDMRISHRFGRLDEGVNNFFGLDDANTRLGVDYGITRWLMVGIGHSAFRKVNDGFVKAKVLQQRQNGTPVTLSYFGSAAVGTETAPAVPAGAEYFFTNRLSYVHQLLVARKFSDRLSLQLMPTVVHHNLVDSTTTDNNTYAIGAGGRVKLSRRMALTAEYFYRVNNTDVTVGGLKTYNVLSVGLDIETGGHVFQLMFTNSLSITDNTSLTQTTDSWGDGGIHFGFNISRVFTIVKPKEFK